VEDYGLLVNQHLADMIEGGGDREVFGAGNKHHPADFVLWKLAKPGEPAWPSPWGDGRPGWHSECVVMSLDILGEGFDLHCGGMDLKFPHHENERAQAVALGKRFANHWMHNGFVVDSEGEKMSKSLGNVHNLLDLLELYDPRAYRMLLLQSHYRGPVSVGQDNIDASVKALARFDGLARRFTSPAAAPDPAVLDAFRVAMDDDLNTPAAMAIVFDAITQANAAADAGDMVRAHQLFAAVQSIAEALGLTFSTADEVPAEAAAKAAALDAARAAKDFAAADTLRAELQAAGWTVETTKSGTTLRR
jgi:cysteinyl-tRNA synthetase